MRERRRQRGLPLPITDKVLPFRAGSIRDTTSDESPIKGDDCLSAADPLRLRVALAEEQVAGTFAALQDAEQREASRGEPDRLEEAYHCEATAYKAAVAKLVQGKSDAS